MIGVDVAKALARNGSILCLGAHCDDIEIGCGGTILRLLGENPRIVVTWMILCSTPRREKEAIAGASRFLRRSVRTDVRILKFRDGFLPSQMADVKDCFERLKGEVDPGLIFTPYRNDLHQDHRLASELTWNTFRNHLILEYEIPKYDGDLGAPSAFFPLSRAECASKISHLLKAYPSQRGKDWFTEDTFRAVLRIRGMECRSPSGFAEAFYCRKVVF
jgi:LmbE family N-acetylglucosaminyl deacetylase